MKNIRDIAVKILHHEGGYVNDPDDLGGATNRGVTIGTLRRLGIDNDGDGDIDVNDLKLLSEDQAIDIYLRHYFYEPKIDQLPTAIQASVFDMYINSGTNAVKILQRLLRSFGEDILVDGVIGRFTIARTHRVYKKVNHYLINAYGIERRNYYYRIADQRVANRKFARTRTGNKGGWIRRAEIFIDKKYHLTLQEHHKRIAAWG